MSEIFTGDQIIAAAEYCEFDPASITMLVAALRRGKGDAASPDIPEIDRWRWVDCTPHQGYMERRTDGVWVKFDDLAAYTERIRSEQRERDALICEAFMDPSDDGWDAGMREAAAAIREQAAGRTE